MIFLKEKPAIQNVESKETSESKPTKTLSKNGRTRKQKVLSKEDTDTLRIDRIFKMEGKNLLDKRRIRSSEPLRNRYANNNEKSKTLMDGRDSVRLKNKASNEQKDTVTAENKPEDKIPRDNSQGLSDKDEEKDEATNESCEEINDKIKVTKNEELVDDTVNYQVEITEELRESVSGNDNSVILQEEAPAIKVETNEENVEENLCTSNGKENGLSQVRYKLKPPLRRPQTRIPTPIRSKRAAKNNYRFTKSASGENKIVKDKRLEQLTSIPPIEIEIEEEKREILEEETNENQVRDEPQPPADNENDSLQCSESVEDSDTEQDNTDPQDKKEDDSQDSTDDEYVSCTEKKENATQEEILQKEDAITEQKKTDSLTESTLKNVPASQLLRIHGITLTRERLKKLRSIVDKAAQVCLFKHSLLYH